MNVKDVSVVKTISLTVDVDELQKQYEQLQYLISYAPNSIDTESMWALVGMLGVMLDYAERANEEN